MESRGRLNNLDRYIKYWHTQTVFGLGTKTSTNGKLRNYSIKLEGYRFNHHKASQATSRMIRYWFKTNDARTLPDDMPQISTGRIKASLPGFIPTNIKYVFSIKMYIQSAKT